MSALSPGIRNLNQFFGAGLNVCDLKAYTHVSLCIYIKIYTTIYIIILRETKVVYKKILEIVPMPKRWLIFLAV